ncbi:hypothetical protein FRB91_010921 [Serendipita sp. 411]|nr:hypothetical protein FRC16_010505 [Serendipita sp. 398]KAG8828163.1 hypothetical protein FRC19_009247 [Serendipita sp. 401]KAG8848343.1 hypothetical protein FRB91_010921 [Serendipita sp. 411]KAG8862067.1 hypothetical protein FRC20_011362 [Serendipita sp. 405]
MSLRRPLPSTGSQGLEKMKGKANISYLPTEIWQMILRYAIAVPIFFDPDVVGSFVTETSFIDRLGDWNYDSAYWESERERNGISRVCKRWNDYLAQFQHRFVRMEDIRKGRLQPGVLKYARRISINGTYSPAYDVAEQTWQCALDYGDLPVEIITFVRLNQMVKEMMLNVGALKHLATVCSEEEVDESGALPITTISASLRHLHSVRIPKSSFQSFLTSSCLVSLTIDLPASFFANIEIPRYHLPSLQTLRVTGATGRDDPSIAASFVVPFLRQQRPEIKRLYIFEREKIELLPYEIWDLCPHLEVIGISIMPGPPPHTSHPVSEFVVSNTFPRSQRQLERSFFPSWPNLKTITIDKCWNTVVLPCPAPWIARCQQLGIRLQDARGVSWDEHSTKKNLKLDEKSEWIIRP